MDVDYDADKGSINRFKHKLSLAFGRHIFDDPAHIIIASFRPIDGEDRYEAVGMVKDRLHTVVYVWRGDRMRFISVRRSNRGEQGNYHRHSGGPE